MIQNFHIVSLLVIIPLAAGFLTSILGKYVKRSSEVIVCISSGAILCLSVYIRLILNSVPNKLIIYNIGGWKIPFGVCMVIDGLSSYMLLVVNFVAFFIALYSLAYIEKYTDKPKFFTLFSIMLCGVNGVILAGDMFNLFVFLELASITGYALAAFSTDAESLEASFRYSVMGIIASSFIFLSIALLYGFTSTLNMAYMAKALLDKESLILVNFVGMLLVAGFGLKSALVPFHAWLPDTYSQSPAPVSAMLSGSLIKSVGVYSVVRIFFNIIGPESYLGIFTTLGTISIIAGVILALSQWDLKRLLAYHSISQIGYIFLGIGLGTPLGIFGGLFHLFNHSIFKPLLFLNAGAIDYATGTKNLKETSGLAKVMPVTAGTNLIASLSISGIPPFNGFFSKLIIIIACIESGHFWLSVCAVVGSIMTLASFMKVQKFVFLGELGERFKSVKEAPLIMQFSMIALAIICIIGGLVLLPQFRFIITDAADSLVIKTGYYKLILGIK